MRFILFKNRDVSLSLLLLLVLGSCATGKVSSAEPSIHTIAILTDSKVVKLCYTIPYSEKQLEEITAAGGEKLEAFKNDLYKITADVDLNSMVGEPKIVMGEKTSQLCLDLQKNTQSDDFRSDLT